MDTKSKHMTEDDNTYHFVYKDDVLTSVTEALAWIEGVESSKLEPLYTFIDPEALCQVVESGDTAVSFKAYGHDIYVDSDGTIVIGMNATGNGVRNKE